MKVTISTILCCLVFHFSYSQEGFWGVKFGASLDSTSKNVFRKHELISYQRDKKLTYRNGIVEDSKFNVASLLFNESDQLYKGTFIFRPSSYADMVAEYQLIETLIEMQTFAPDNVGSNDSIVKEDADSAYSIWHYPKGAEEGSIVYTILLTMDFKYAIPTITLEYTSNKFFEK